ncbi:hypothetical protein EVAR_18247_1 [Eumeta japonica]|uniref:Reverse transcriptase domain-containing protein n=1 Tax=Eumeta variegata TaxID=151549 RepID=A0A4C1UKD2_EUMVA|nr:hypothetical protein EVAR_18247_1 [Eumeta japonica]
MHGVSSGLIQALLSLYRDSSACVRINGAHTDWFDIHRGVKRGCVASPWLFNLFMDSCLHDLKEYECGLRMDELSVKYLLYAYDQVILGPHAVGVRAVGDAREPAGRKPRASGGNNSVYREFRFDNEMTQL